MTVVDRVRWQCRLYPDEPALALPDAHEVVTYGRLDYYLNNACRTLTAMGIVPGTVYGLVIKDPLLHLVLSLALEQLGAATMALPDLDIPDTWTFTAILRDRDLGDSARRTVLVDKSWLQGDGRPSTVAELSGPFARRCLPRISHLRFDRRAEGRLVHAPRLGGARRTLRLHLWRLRVPQAIDELHRRNGLSLLRLRAFPRRNVLLP